MGRTTFTRGPPTTDMGTGTTFTGNDHFWQNWQNTNLFTICFCTPEMWSGSLFSQIPYPPLKTVKTACPYPHIDGARVGPGVGGGRTTYRCGGQDHLPNKYSTNPILVKKCKTSAKPGILLAKIDKMLFYLPDSVEEISFYQKVDNATSRTRKAVDATSRTKK